MGSRTPNVTARQAALVAGWALLAMTACWLLTDWLVFRSLVVPNDALATAQNLIASESLYRAGILGVLLVLLLDVLVAWAL